MSLQIVILAGGEGRRIGGSKPLRRIGGKSLIDIAADRARSWSDRIAVSARSADQVPGARHPVLLDPAGLEGPLAGLAAALKTAGDRVLTIPCDMPFLPDDLPERLEAALGDREAALAASEGQVHAVCGLWRTRVLPRLYEYASTGRRSMIGLAEVVGFVAVEWPDSLLFNVNDPAGLAEAERRMAKSKDG